MVTLFVSSPKPAPASFNEFNTIISAFLFFNFSNAFVFSLFVSRANPTTTCPFFFFSPRLFKISCCFGQFDRQVLVRFLDLFTRFCNRRIICNCRGHHSDIAFSKCFMLASYISSAVVTLVSDNSIGRKSSVVGPHNQRNFCSPFLQFLCNRKSHFTGRMITNKTNRVDGFVCWACRHQRFLPLSGEVKKKLSSRKLKIFSGSAIRPSP